MADDGDGRVKPCEGCGNPSPWARHPKREAFTGRWYEECNRCFDPSIPKHPDVYFRRPYWDPNLFDMDSPLCDPRRGTWITSKAHKAYVMKKLGVREMGDRQRGKLNFDPISHKFAAGSLKKYEEAYHGRR